ncbi:MAG: BrnT family toxin [Rhizobiales bacterium]|nr:BrnT family toxin [Hyphomicrobiales bacterium]
MRVTFDPAKRELTLRERGLDFAEAAKVFAGRHATRNDDRKDYGEPRRITAGFLGSRMVVLVWTPRGGERRIISMRYAHAKETKRWKKVLG